MVEFKENTLYGLEELREMLDGVVSLPTLLERLGLRDQRVFRDALWGWEILQASRRAPAFSESPEAAVLEVANRVVKQRKADEPVRKLTIHDLDT